jgi:PAS domain S-box-containing protein
MIDAARLQAILTLDPTGRILSWNRGAEHAFGCKADAAIGQYFDIVFPTEDRAAGEPARALEAARTLGKHEAQGWHVDSNGQYQWNRSVTEAIHDDSGALMGFLRVTQFSRNVDQTVAAQFQKQKQIALAHFSRRLIHDYSNLLTIIVNNLERMRTGKADEKRTQRLAEGALHAAQRAMTLTHGLYLFSGGDPARGELVDVAELLDVMEPSMHVACGDNNVKLGVSVDLRSPVSHFDPMDFEAALMNLIGNARDAMPQGGTIAVSARNVEIDPERAQRTRVTPGRYIAVTVADGGTGMTPEVRDRALEPFFTTKEVGNGSGLGLAQAHGFASQCGGSLEIETAPGRGTTVTLHLPIATESDRDAAR